MFFFIPCLKRLREQYEVSLVNLPWNLDEEVI